MPESANFRPKPFLKWAGGKTQLIPSIQNALPPDFAQIKDVTYVEPFVGSGAVLFWILQAYPNIKKAVINDVNSDLTNAYHTLKEDPHTLIEALTAIQKKYQSLESLEKKADFYKAARDEFNSRSGNILRNTALLIFLNRTCFNGLYRVNSRNQFNVPFGKHINPKICDSTTILAAGKLLQKVIILNGDYEEAMKYAKGRNSFFYLDPPYRPLTKTASFNAYARNSFDDNEQIRLRSFCDALTQRKSFWLLSNSDPKNVHPHDSFFDDLYTGAGIFIERVKAKRNINSNGAKRGAINEILISNYRR